MVSDHTVMHILIAVGIDIRGVCGCFDQRFEQIRIVIVMAALK